MGSSKTGGVKFELPRPQHVDDEQWEAIEQASARMAGAVERGDWSLVLGSAKELCETIAKIVWLLRGEQFGARTDYPKLISGAHKLVFRLPGSGHAAGSSALEVADAAVKTASRLGNLRNAGGTGHGRAAPPSADEEDARFASGIALLWCRWMLARLDAVVAATPEAVAADFRTNIFRKGDATLRLAEAGLAQLKLDEQRLIGVAVGQRAASGTMTVAREGVLAPAEDPDLRTWPEEYRRGVAEGLFIDRDGYLTGLDAVGPRLVNLLAPLEDGGAAAVTELASRIEEAEIAYSRRALPDGLAESVREAASKASPALSRALQTLADRIAATADPR